MTAVDPAATAARTPQWNDQPTTDLHTPDLHTPDLHPADLPRNDPPRPGCSPHFIGTFVGDPGTAAVDQAEIVLRGELDADAVDRVGEHIAALLDTSIRFLSIDATAVDRVDPALLDLLSATQRRLGRRQGMIALRGLHPSRLAPDEHTR